MAYWVYFDSGTSNTRIYLLNEAFEVLYTEKRHVGSRDSAIAGDNLVLIQGIKDLYDRLLQQNQIKDEDIRGIYASGMITCPDGLVEVPHLALPMTVQEFSGHLHCHHEEKLFHRDIYLVPGLKSIDGDIDFVNNMRGEEIEIMGALDELSQRFPGRKVAVILPGSHTHITCVQDDQICGIISNFTGELFYALQTCTILSPILSAETEGLNPAMVQKGMENVQRFGFNRALYICRTMKLFQNSSDVDCKSYAEGVINGGLAQSLSYYCEHLWQGCDAAAIISNEYLYHVFREVLRDHPYIHDLTWLPISATKSYGVQGLKKILTCSH